MINEELRAILGEDLDDSKADKLEAIFTKNLQSEADKVRTKYASENKELTAKLKEKELENMSELEKKETLLNEQKQDFEKQRKEWAKDRIVKEKTDFFKEKKASLELFDLVKGDTAEAWENSLANIKNIINKQVEMNIKSNSGRANIEGNKEPIIAQDIGLKAFDNAFKN